MLSYTSTLGHCLQSFIAEAMDAQLVPQFPHGNKSVVARNIFETGDNPATKQEILGQTEHFG
jgi:hypothetical protein